MLLFAVESFIESTHMPDMLFINTIPGLLVEAEYSYIRDRYGAVYYAIGGGIILGGSAVEAWEGYAKPNFSGNVPRPHPWNLLSRSELKNIITGPSYTLNVTTGVAGVGYILWQPGFIALFGEKSLSVGISLSGAVTWEAAQREYALAWDWLDKIPRHSAP
ncbi:MAG: hypothetical protein ACT6FF_08760 [Methanosarcinaceae archaeon]